MCGLGSREVRILFCGQPWLLWTLVAISREQGVRAEAVLVWGHRLAFGLLGDFSETQSWQEPQDIKGGRMARHSLSRGAGQSSGGSLRLAPGGLVGAPTGLV